ncbi:hypothetical protein [Acinetobacter gerneri]|jgi:hypothetical protein|uniref:hypothetical protein n=1 Tax=Acinetobacter gerneri TaxID=202952 RepID=UPI0023F26127|nr:hypothetical protein [Acinetobacter gerneri]MCH4242921.1 hypothetical protein [Acinetobacter gerneri]
MTFIIAIQSSDSIILSADNRAISTDSNQKITIHPQENIGKMATWNQGAITGTGDYVTFQRMTNKLKINQDIGQLPAMLKEYCSIRKNEIGMHEQIDKTVIIYSYLEGLNPKLQFIHHDQGEIIKHDLQENGLQLFMYKDEIGDILENLKQLQKSIKPRYCFETNEAWMSYYLIQFSEIYRTQSLHDESVSSSFDIFFQTAYEKVHKHVASC